MLGATMRPLLVSSDRFGNHDDQGDDRDNDCDEVGDRW